MKTLSITMALSLVMGLASLQAASGKKGEAIKDEVPAFIQNKTVQKFYVATGMFVTSVACMATAAMIMSLSPNSRIVTKMALGFVATPAYLGAISCGRRGLKVLAKK